MFWEKKFKEGEDESNLNVDDFVLNEQYFIELGDEITKMFEDYRRSQKRLTHDMVKARFSLTEDELTYTRAKMALAEEKSKLSELEKDKFNNNDEKIEECKKQILNAERMEQIFKRKVIARIREMFVSEQEMLASRQKCIDDYFENLIKQAKSLLTFPIKTQEDFDRFKELVMGELKISEVEFQYINEVTDLRDLEEEQNKKNEKFEYKEMRLNAEMSKLENLAREKAIKSIILQNQEKNVFHAGIEQKEIDKYFNDLIFKIEKNFDTSNLKTQKDFVLFKINVIEQMKISEELFNYLSYRSDLNRLKKDKVFNDKDYERKKIRFSSNIESLKSPAEEEANKKISKDELMLSDDYFLNLTKNVEAELGTQILLNIDEFDEENKKQYAVARKWNIPKEEFDYANELQSVKGGVVIDDSLFPKAKNALLIKLSKRIKFEIPEQKNKGKFEFKRKF